METNLLRVWVPLLTVLQLSCSSQPSAIAGTFIDNVRNPDSGESFHC